GRRLQEIDAELPELWDRAAAGSADAEQEAAKLEGEKEWLRAQVREAISPSGKPRQIRKGNAAALSADRVKSALNSVRQQLKDDSLATRCPQSIADKLALLSAHLRLYVKQEGDGYAYRPDPDLPAWHVQG